MNVSFSFTSWWTSRYVAVFPSNFRVSGITPRSIRGTTIRVTTHVRVILTIRNIFRYPPVTMGALRGPLLTIAARPCDVYIATIPNADVFTMYLSSKNTLNNDVFLFI